MKTPRILFAVLVAAFLTAVSASAADPTGKWTWTQETRNGQTRESALTLELKEGQLTGSISGRGGETPISDASFVDDVVAFVLVREFNGNRIEQKYSGKLDGNTITGTVERGGRDGQTRTTEWVAKRAE